MRFVRLETSGSQSVRRARGGADGLSDWALPAASGGAGRSRLVHRGGEKPSNRCITEPTKAKMLHLSEACCGDLNLTVAAVKLAARDGLDVGAEMFRGWLLAKSPAHFQRHERPSLAWRAWRVHVGELIPLDWSPHDWVEGAAGPVSGWRILLMPSVWVYARFYDHEGRPRPWTVSSVMQRASGCRWTLMQVSIGCTAPRPRRSN